ncbi:heat shock protein HslJ [Actinocrispum wychmicini]|uniref:Heat shock protein HslJ n=2 Tax=Actinocrispum wychmicini TaxID=1213861 RepID=A0A4R2JYF6_9PSEU|nr:heat shock protein HslJ [Actinocrispum wychmicini]
MGLAAAVALVLVVAGCGSDTPKTTTKPPDIGAAGAPLRGHTYLSDSVTDQGQAHTLVAGTRVSIQFEDSGDVVAQVGCNSIVGPVKLDSGKVAADLAMTQKSCDDDLDNQDKWLYDVLNGDATWKLDGSTLRIASGATEIVLSEAKNVPLTGTTWQIDSIVGGDTGTTTPPKGSLVFTDRKVTVSTGCNTGEGDYQAAGQRLAVSTVAMTRKACPPDLAETEQAILAVLSGDVDYKIEGRVLTLTSAAGTGLRLQAAN